MLDAVVCQKWDNIEVVLVNDGDTDMTRETVKECEGKMRLHGFEIARYVSSEIVL